jgi:alanyl-tRNA synthetase
MCIRDRTSEIGLLKITGESSVGANLRRIEAVTSFDAYEYTVREETELAGAARALRVGRLEVAERAALVAKRLKEAEAGAGRQRDAVSGDEVSRMLGEVVDAGGYRLLVTRAPQARPQALRGMWDELRTRGVEAAVLVTSDIESAKPIFIAAGSDEAVAAGFDGGAVVRAMAPLLGGRGGGKPAMAQGGGEDASGIDDALRTARVTLGLE